PYSHHTCVCALAAPHPRTVLFPYTTLFRARMPSFDELARAVEAKEYPAGIGTPDALQDPRNTLLTAHRGPLLVAYLWLASHTVEDRKSTRLNTSHVKSSYAVFCLKKKKKRM